MMRSMAEVKQAFETQLQEGLGAIAPGPSGRRKGQCGLSSDAVHQPPARRLPGKGVLLHGGGARYNFSGIQCVGPADAGDSLYAIERAVFRDHKLNLPDLVRQLKQDLPDSSLAAYLNNLPKYGNDLAEADDYTRYVIETFSGFLQGKKNTRGGTYTTGVYSVTAHNYFGKVTGALPSGRKKGGPSPPAWRPPTAGTGKAPRPC